MQKFSAAEAGQMMKLAAENLRALSAENQTLKEKVAHYEKHEKAERIAATMEEKGLEPELSLSEKIAGLMKRDDLSVVEEAVGMSAPQMKLASVHDAGLVQVEGGTDSQAEAEFASRLASL